MLEVDYLQPSGLIEIRQDTPPTSFLEFWNKDCTLARQLPEADEQMPDAFFFTAISAIPVADAVRGYYSALNRQHPQLFSIPANCSTSRIYNDHGHSEIFKFQSASFRESMTNIKSAVVIDQFCASGKTLNYAGKLLLASGVERVQAIIGNWYCDVVPLTRTRLAAEVNCWDLTSPDREFMVRVGQECAAIHRSRISAAIAATGK